MLKCKGIISNAQRKILLFLGDVPDLANFYLSGGTALAEFYLAHRESYDLDFFTSENGIILPFSRQIEVFAREHGFHIEIIRRFESFAEFVFTVGDEKVKVQFALDSPFRFDNLEESELGIKVNPYKDIIVDKLLAFYGRVELRDAVDVYFILAKEDFWQMVKSAAQKDHGFDLYWFAVACQKVADFPDNIDDWPVKMLKKVDASEIKRLFGELAVKIMVEIKK